MTEPNLPRTPADHAAHDPTWMAALASRHPDLGVAERTRAQAALETCGACADLFADLVAISATIPTAAVPARPREFTLTQADAARLRSRGLRRLLKAIGTARDGVTFPLALGLTTMGIAGLLVATVPSFAGAGGAASAPATLSTVGEAIPAPAAASAAPIAPAASGVRGQETEAYGAAPSSDAAGGGGGEVFSGDGGDGLLEAQRQDANDMADDAFIRDDGTGLSTLMIVAATLLIVGLGLFALRWTARRLGDG